MFRVFMITICCSFLFLNGCNKRDSRTIRKAPGGSARVSLSDLRRGTSAFFVNGIRGASEGRFNEAEEQFRKDTLEPDSSQFMLTILDDLKNGVLKQEAVINFFKAHVALQDMKSKEQAKNYFQKAIQINQNFAQAYCDLGLVYFNLSQKQQALTYCQKAIEINPRLPQAYFYLGLIHLSQMDLKSFSAEEAKNGFAYFNKATELKPDYLIVYITAGAACSKIGQHQQAIAYYVKAKEIYQKRENAENVKLVDMLIALEY